MTLRKDVDARDKRGHGAGDDSISPETAAMSQAVSIRPVDKGDAAALGSIHVRAWRETYQHLLPAEILADLSETQRADMWTRILADEHAGKNHVFGAWKDGELIGFVSGGKSRSDVENSDSELYAIYVLQCAQRRQIGRRLFRTLTSQLFASGHRRMFLWVLQGNSSSGFYERLGGHRGPPQETTIGGRQFTEWSYVFELNESQTECVSD